MPNPVKRPVTPFVVPLNTDSKTIASPYEDTGVPPHRPGRGNPVPRRLADLRLRQGSASCFTLLKYELITHLLSQSHNLLQSEIEPKKSELGHKRHWLSDSVTEAPHVYSGARSQTRDKCDFTVTRP